MDDTVFSTDAIEAVKSLLANQAGREEEEQEQLRGVADNTTCDKCLTKGRKERGYGVLRHMQFKLRLITWRREVGG